MPGVGAAARTGIPSRAWCATDEWFLVLAIWPGALGWATHTAFVSDKCSVDQDAPFGFRLT